MALDVSQVAPSLDLVLFCLVSPELFAITQQALELPGFPFLIGKLFAIVVIAAHREICGIAVHFVDSHFLLHLLVLDD